MFTCLRVCIGLGIFLLASFFASSSQASVLEVQGCTDPIACNFNPLADTDDGSCTYPVSLTLQDSGLNGWQGATYVILTNTGELYASGTITEGSSEEIFFCIPAGCYSMDVSPGDAPQEISWFITDDDDQIILNGGAPYSGFFAVGGMCMSGCSDATACNYTPFGTDEMTCCYVSGCTNPEACNFDPNACCDNGSCVVLDPAFSLTLSPAPNSYDLNLSASEYLEGVYDDEACWTYILERPDGEQTILDPDQYGDGEGAVSYIIPPIPGEYSVCLISCCPTEGSSPVVSCQTFTIPDPCPGEDSAFAGFIVPVDGPGTLSYVVTNSDNVVLASGDQYYAGSAIELLDFCLPPGCYNFQIQVPAQVPSSVAIEGWWQTLEGVMISSYTLSTEGVIAEFNISLAVGGSSGCSDPDACNYDPLAVCPLNCIYPDPTLYVNTTEYQNLDEEGNVLLGDLDEDGLISVLFTLETLFGGEGLPAGCNAFELTDPNLNTIQLLPDLDLTGEFSIPGDWGVMVDLLAEPGMYQICYTACCDNGFAIHDSTLCLEFFIVDVVSGCTDPLACNFNAEANVDDQSCAYGSSGCGDQLACNYDPEATCNDGSCVYGSLYYLDLDGDGFGSPFSAIPSCEPLEGYVTIGGDCNDSNNSVYPGAPEICGNGIDEDCNGFADDECASPLVPNDNRSAAENLVPAAFGTCFAESGTVTGATVSPQSNSVTLSGEDVWYRFTANSVGVRVVVDAPGFDAVIELQDAAGNTLAQENVISGVGIEILNHYNPLTPLITGQQYFIAVRNFNSGAGSGSFTICVQRIRASACNVGPGPFGMCDVFKASWVGAQSYQFAFVDTESSETFLASSSSGITTVPLGMLTPERSYTVSITANYNLFDGAGNPEPISITTAAACIIAMAPHPVVDLREADRCSNGPRPVNAFVAANKWICGAAYYQWRFKQTAPVVDVDYGVPVTAPPVNRFLNLAPLTLTPGATYDVQVRPIFSSGAIGSWSALPRCLQIIGPASAQLDQSPEYLFGPEGEEGILVYPNPASNGEINLIISGMSEGHASVKLYDVSGRLVASHRLIITSERMNLSLPLNAPSGCYTLEWEADGIRVIKKVVVAD